jgi:hypothetical protein
MDGGFHNNPYVKSELSISDSKYIDEQKDLLAMQHDIEVIRIDCDYRKISERYSFIKQNMLKSILSKIINLTHIDFHDADIKSLQSLLIESCKLWNDGMTVTNIGEAIGVSVQTARSYLTSGMKCGLCDYSKSLSRIRSKTQIPVICLNDFSEYKSITEAAEKYMLTPESIRSCCCGKTLSSGEENGNRIVWKYLDDFAHMKTKDIKQCLIDAYTKKVVCISKIYYSLQLKTLLNGLE